MTGRYELRHPVYGKGYRWTRLDLAIRDLSKSIPVNEWFIYDRLEKRRLS